MAAPLKGPHRCWTDQIRYDCTGPALGLCVTIRDAQLLERQLIENEKIQVDKKVDMEMESERLKAIRIYEERDIKRHEDRIAGTISRPCAR